MKYWKNPKDEHIVYEAVTAILDGRVEKVDEGEYKIYSSSRNKFYVVKFVVDKSRGEAAPFAGAIRIMSNDNMAYFRKEISYPMLTVMLQENIIKINLEKLGVLKGVKWKDINQKNKNDYMKSVEEVLNVVKNCGADVEEIKKSVAEVWKELGIIKVGILGKFKKPSSKY